MKNQSMAKLSKAAGDSRVAMKMKTESAMKMKEKSPMEKELVGKQGNLPPELKAKIEAAPSKMKSAMKATDAELMAADKAKLNKGARQQDGKGKTDKERSAMKKDLPEVRITGKKEEKKEGYNPDGTVDKNSQRYKDAVAAAKRKKENEKKQEALDGKVKSGSDLSFAERTQVASQDKNKTTFFTGKSKKPKKEGGKSPMAKKLDDKNKKRYREIKKVPKKEIKGVDRHSKVSGLLLESNGKKVRQSMKIAGRTFVNKQNNDERTRDYIAKNQPKAVVPKDMPKGKKKETIKQFEKKAMRK